MSCAHEDSSEDFVNGIVQQLFPDVIERVLADDNLLLRLKKICNGFNIEYVCPLDGFFFEMNLDLRPFRDNFEKIQNTVKAKPVYADRLNVGLDFLQTIDEENLPRTYNKFMTKFTFFLHYGE